jgi:hypothetical protein
MQAFPGGTSQEPETLPKVEISTNGQYNLLPVRVRVGFPLLVFGSHTRMTRPVSGINRVGNGGKEYPMPDVVAFGNPT